MIETIPYIYLVSDISVCYNVPQNHIFACKKGKMEGKIFETIKKLMRVEIMPALQQKVQKKLIVLRLTKKAP